MTYTFISARFANAEQTAADVATEERGAVILSEADTPDDWAALLGSEIEIGTYEPSPVDLPALSPRQLRLMMLQIEISDDDVEAQIAMITDESERAGALIEWRWATHYNRSHPLVVALSSALEFTESELDALWLYAVDL